MNQQPKDQKHRRVFQIPEHPDLRVEMELTSDGIVLRPNTSEIALNTSGAMVFCKAIMDMVALANSREEGECE